MINSSAVLKAVLGSVLGWIFVHAVFYVAILVNSCGYIDLSVSTLLVVTFGTVAAAFLVTIRTHQKAIALGIFIGILGIVAAATTQVVSDLYGAVIPYSGIFAPCH